MSDSESEVVNSQSEVDPGTMLAQALSKILTKKEKPRLPNFSGRSSKNNTVSFKEWLYSVDKAMKSKKYKELSSDDFTEIVFNSLCGEAKTRFIRLEQIHNDLEGVLQDMKDTYQDCTPTIDLVQQLHSAKQGAVESIAGFADRIEQQVFEIECAGGKLPFERGATLKAIFLKGLKDRKIPDMLLYLKDNEKVSYEMTRTKAIALERDSCTRQVKSVTAPSNDEQKETISQLTDRISQLEKMLEQKSKDRAVRTCHYCDKPGHFIRDCRLRQQDRRNQSSNQNQSSNSNQC